MNCQKIFTTKETPLADNLFVIKRNKSRQRFIYEKLFVSLFTIFNLKKHRDNGDSAKLAKKISEKIIKTILASQKTREITSADLIVLAANQLKKIKGFFADQYIHYSPYRREVALSRGVIKV